MNRINHPYSQDGTDEVEDLLRQAEDAALLKLSVNGHMAHHSSSDLPPDLADRFQSLKSGPFTSKSSQNSSNSSTARAELGKNQPAAPIDDDPDDLLARFTALKASIPKPSSLDPVGEESADLDADREDEVDKIIRWAVDAARLDPSPESDDEENENSVNGSGSDSDTSEEDEEDDYRKKEKKKKKKSERA